MMSTRVGFLSLCLMLPAATAPAQIVDAVVADVVRDAQAAGVAGAGITATNEQSGISRSVRSDAEGRYHLPPSPAGIYTFRVQRQGFRTIVRLHQTLNVGSTSTIDFTFEAVTTSDTVTVTAGAVLEATTHTLSRLISRGELDALPLVDWNFNGLATITPGVTPTGIYGGVDISGARDFQNAYNVDGASAEGTSLGDQRLAYAQDWIQEFQVLASQFSVEFGRASGGVLNAITRSGSNRYATRAHGYFRNEAWDAKPFFAAAKLPLSSARWGGTTGGPVRCDAVFYFAGVERLDRDTAAVVNTSFPEANGSKPITTAQTLALGKVEWFRGQSALRFRVNADAAHTTNAGIGGVVTEENGTTVDWHAAEALASWSRPLAGGFNELRTAFSTTASDTACNFARTHAQGTWFGRSYPAAQFGCPTGFGWIDGSEWQLIDNLSWVHGGHAIKAGASVSRARNSGDFAQVRVTKLLPFGSGRRAAVLLEIYNATNAVNLTTYIGSLESLQFGLPSVALDPRRVQLGFRIDF